MPDRRLVRDEAPGKPVDDRALRGDAGDESAPAREQAVVVHRLPAGGSVVAAISKSQARSSRSSDVGRSRRQVGTAAASAAQSARWALSSDRIQALP